MDINKVMKFVLVASMSMQASSVFATSINYALNGRAFADGLLTGHGPEKAIDGDNTSYWSAGYSPSPNFLTASISIDLGASLEITEINAYVVQSPAGNTVHKIYLDKVLSHTWNQFTDTGDLLTWILPTNTNAQLITIETVSSPSWAAWGEISVLNEVSQVPVPASVWMFGTGLIGLIGVKKKALKSPVSPA